MKTNEDQNYKMNEFSQSITTRATYAYDAQDVDELSFNPGDVIEILKEGNIFKIDTNFIKTFIILALKARSCWSA